MQDWGEVGCMRRTIEKVRAQCCESSMNLHKLVIRAPARPVSSGSSAACQFWHRTACQFWHLHDLHSLSVLPLARSVSLGTCTVCQVGTSAAGHFSDHLQLHGLSILAPT